MKEYKIPEIDLVIVDLYPFEETLRNTNEEKLIIEKIDIGGASMIRAAAKNYKDLVVIAAKDDYASLVHILETQHGETAAEQRRAFAAKAFEVVAHYDVAIAKYFFDPIIRALVGDVLVVILIYFFCRSFINGNTKKIALGVFLLP